MLAGFLLSYFICGFLISPLKLYIAIVGSFLFLFLVCLSFILKTAGFFEKFRILLPCAALLLSISLSCLSSYMNFDYKIRQLSEKYDEKECEILISVISADKMSEFYSSHEVQLLEINGEKIDLKGQLTSSYFNAYDNGDTLRITAYVDIKDDLSDKSDSYLISKGILIEVISESEESTEYLGNKGVFPDKFLYDIRRNISYIIHENTDDMGTELSKALLYGDRSGLPYLFTDSFRELGVSHMLAISGMHFSVIVGMLAAFLSGLRINRRISVILLSLFVLFYAFIAGFSPSVTRAAFMLLLSYVSIIFVRRSDSLTSLLCAAFIICIFNPYALYDIGMQLSFFATLGIITVALPVNEKIKQSALRSIRPLYYILTALNITLSAILFTTPISFFHFGSISVFSPIANLIFTPFITILLYLIPICVILSPLKPISLFIGHIIDLISDLMRRMAYSLAQSSDFSIDMRYTFCILLIIFTIISIILLIILVKDIKNKRELVYIPLVIFMISAYVGNQIILLPYKNAVSICYYTEESSDAVILTDHTETILCDSSEGYYRFVKNAIEYADDLTKNEITTYMITDYHYPHIATVTKLLELTSIRKFILPYPPERDLGYHTSISEFLIRNGCSVTFYTPGKDTVNFKNFNIDVSVYEQKTANPASIIHISSPSIANSYTYVSNAVSLAQTNKEFLNDLQIKSSLCDYVICGSHGDSENAISLIEGRVSHDIIYGSFYCDLRIKE